jgi:hypothetical protein
MSQCLNEVCNSDTVPDSALLRGRDLPLIFREHERGYTVVIADATNVHGHRMLRFFKDLDLG